MNNTKLDETLFRKRTLISCDNCKNNFDPNDQLHYNNSKIFCSMKCYCNFLGIHFGDR